MTEDDNSTTEPEKKDKATDTDEPTNIEKIEMSSQFINTPSTDRVFSEGEHISDRHSSELNPEDGRVDIDVESFVTNNQERMYRNDEEHIIQKILHQAGDGEADDTTGHNNLRDVLSKYNPRNLTLESEVNPPFGTRYILTATVDMFGMKTKTVYEFDEMTDETKTLLATVGVDINTGVDLTYLKEKNLK